MAEWEALLADKDTCVTPVKNLDEVFSDPHVIENELVVELEDEKLGTYRQIGIPVKLSVTPGRLMKRAPELGEHTEELLEQIGYTKSDIQQIREKGVI